MSLPGRPKGEQEPKLVSAEGSPSAAYLVVRSVVAREPDRVAFDRWYGSDHMPKALRMLGALEGWRFWSETEPSVHYAVYRYPSLEALHGRDYANRRALMDEYESAWPGVTRTREVLRMVERATA